MLTLTQFSMQRPEFEISQERALAWLAEIHAAAEAKLEGWPVEERDAFALRMQKLLQRCACGPDKISKRGHVSSDLGSSRFDDHELYDATRHPHGGGTALRSKLFAEAVNAYFTREYEREQLAPSDLIHVTCTGYVAPSGAQRLVSEKGWGALTRVTHAYHMGCYAAFPALRLAAGQLLLSEALRSANPERRVDIVHTELCSLHLDPSNHSAEQCVVQSLFADGFIRYSVRDVETEPGLAVLSLGETVLADSAASMGWGAGDFGMHMNLSRDVPAHIAAALRPFVSDLFRRAGVDLASQLRSTTFAVHPGGPKIIDQVRDVLELRDDQVEASRRVLFDYGNMSSATLPHVWMRLLADENVPKGRLIVSLAFGPGLTVCGGLFQKR